MKYRWPIIFWSLCATLFAACIVLQFDGAYGQDAYEYLRYSQVLKNNVLTGGELEAFNWPMGYPLMIAIFSLVFDELASGQLVSLLFYGGTLVVSWKFIRLLYPAATTNTVGLYILTFLAFSPYFLRFGLSSMSEAMCSFFVTASFYSYYRFHKNQGSIALLTGLYCMIGALLTRNAALIMVLIPGIAAVYHLIRNRNFGMLALSMPGVAVVALSIFAVPTAQLAGDGVEYSDILNPMNWFNLTAEGSHGIVHKSVPNLFYSFFAFFHPAYFFAGTFFLTIALLKRFPIQKVMVASIVLYSLFIGTIYFQNKRFLVIEIPLVVVLFYGSFEMISARMKQPFVTIALTVSLLINLGLAGYSFRIVYKQQQLELELAESMKTHQGETLYTFWIDPALQGRGLSFDYINLWKDTIEVNREKALILFNEGQFEQQWDKHVLMHNWRLLQRNGIAPMDRFSNGWALYSYPAKMEE